MAIAAVMLGGMGTIAAGSMAMQGWQMSHAPTMPDIKFPDLFTPKNQDDEANKAVEKRRSMYAGMGRSSTILTGPGGLNDRQNVTDASSGSQPKMLLGL